MAVVAIANQKGGVGKTTSAVTIAHGLALRGRRTLIVDLDSQGNVADCLGLESGADLASWLAPDDPQPRAAIVQPTGRPGLDVIRSDKQTVILKRLLAGLDFGVYALAEALAGVAYDAVILDNAPSVDILHTASLLAADWLVNPIKLDQLSMKGLRDMLQMLATLQQHGRATCALAGVLPTHYDRVTRETFEQLAHLAESFGDKVSPPIPLDTQCRVSTRHGKTLWEFAPDTRALVGIANSGPNVGGYAQVIDRLETIL